MSKNTLATLCAAGLSASSLHAATSAYLPEPGELDITVDTQYQHYDEFWVSGTRLNLKFATGFERQEQFSTFLTLEYGIVKDLALDVTLGYTWAAFTGAPVGGKDLTDDGMTDTSIGIRYRLVDEREHSWLPTLTVRVGGILPGTYDDAFPFSAGDGAGGFESSLLLAKEICTGFGIYGEFGYRWRDHDVPEELYGAAGVWTSWRGFTASAGYRHTESTHGPDIGDPGFGTRFGFPQTREIDKRIEAALGYTDGAGRYYGAYYSHTFDGRNTGEKDIYGLTVSIPFGPEPAAPQKGGDGKGYAK